MSGLEDELHITLQDAIHTGSYLGISYVVVGKNGKTVYSGAHGKRSFDTDSDTMTVDTAGWMASMTKLMTTVAAMQVVEQGLVGLDDDLVPMTPALRDDILIDWDETSKTPTFKKAEKKITMRRLLSHSSGLIYDDLSPVLSKWAAAEGKSGELLSGKLTSVERPLAYEPGTQWQYGTGIDWAGRVVETLTGQTLEAFMQERIWSVLGMKNTTFHPVLREEELPMLAMGYRSTGSLAPLAQHEDGPLTALTPGPCPYPYEPKDALGGGGLYSTAEDYSKLLAALLSGEKILKRKTVNLMFEPQLQGPSLQYFLAARATGALQRDVPWQAKANFGLGGLLVLEDLESKRKKGSMCWDGMANPQWMIDLRSGIACAMLTQILPCPDTGIKELWGRLEEIVYRYM